MIRIFKTPQENSKEITLWNNHKYFYTNTTQEYTFVKRREELAFLANAIIKSRKLKKYDISDCYSMITEELFGDYLNSFTFKNINAKKETHMRTKKHLYWLKSDNFYKIGVSYNVNRRVIDLKYEFSEEFEIIKILFHAEELEKKIHKQLEKYKLPIMKKTGDISVECFKICEETTECLNKLNKG